MSTNSELIDELAWIIREVDGRTWLMSAADRAEATLLAVHSNQGGTVTIIQSLDEALNRKVRCTDGGMRRLTHYDKCFGYYQRPIGRVWLDLGGTYLHVCHELFIGGTIGDTSTTTTEAP